MANLFSDLNLGKGSRPWTSSGRDDRGAHSGRGTVFWNLRTDRPGQAIPLPTCDFGPLLTFAFKRHRGSTVRGSTAARTTERSARDLHNSELRGLHQGCWLLIVNSCLPLPPCCRSALPLNGK